MSWQTIITALLLPVITWRIWRWWKMSTFRRWKIPGPEPHLIHGNVQEVRRRGLPQCHIEWTKKYGKVFGYYIGGTPIMVISDSEVLQQILKDDFQSFGNRPISSNGFMVNVGMESKQLIFTQNEQWKVQRTIWKSFFNPTNIKQLMPSMNKVIDTFLSHLPKSSSRQSFDIYELFQELTVDIMGRLMLGLDTDSLSGNQHPLITTFRGFLKKDSGKKFFVSAACFPEFEPLVLPFLKTLEFVRKVAGKSPIHEFIQQCSQHIRARKTINNAPKDLLQVMLDADSPEKTVIADCFSLLFGGYETTSITLAYAVDILAKNQAQQDKVRAEILNPRNANALTEPANLSDTGFLGQVIEEVLRCYNPVPGFIRRQCSRSVQYGSVTIPKGTVVQVPMSFLHMDPEFWSDPEQFKPERFSSENRCTLSSLAHVPFGYGRRNCVAMQFAQTMIRLVLTRLLAQYRILPPGNGDDRDKIPVVYSIIRVVPSKGVFVKAERL